MVTSQSSSGATTWRSGFETAIGVAPSKFPLILGAGVLLLAASQPALIDELAALLEDWVVAEPIFDRLNEFSDWSVRQQRRTEATDAVGWALRASPILVVGMVVAALVRALRSRRFEPVGLVIGGLLAGLFALPVVAWAVIASIWLAGIARSISSFIADVLEFVSPVVGVVVLAAIAIGGLWVLYEAVRLALQHLPLIAQVVLIATVVVAAAAGAYAFIGFVGEAVAWALDAADRVGDAVAVAADWLAFAIVAAGAFLVGAGIFIAVFGQAGQSFVLPVVSAPSSGSDPAACVNCAVAVGLGLGYLLLAGLASPSFGADLDVALAEAWLWPEVVQDVPSAFDALMPDRSVGWVAPAFRSYLPLLEIALVALAGGFATLSMVLGSRRWRAGGSVPVVVPTAWALGLGVATILILLVVGTLVAIAEGEF